MRPLPLTVLLVCGVLVIAVPAASRRWTIVTGHDWGVHEYFDRTGYIRGFSYDLIRGVCRDGNLDCKIVWDKYTNCFMSQNGSHPAGGQGLHGRWYDACFGWVQTVERIHVFKFGDEYRKSSIIHFWVKPGNPRNINARNIQGKKIGFISGWAADEKCLARQDNIQGSYLETEQIVHVVDPDALYELLNKGEVDAVYQGEETMAGYNVEKVALNINCELGGSSVMSRKDSPFPAVWNKAFKKFKNSGEFKALCNEAQSKHGEGADCID